MWRIRRKLFRARIDVLHYNVGLSIAGGDAPPTEITEEAFDRIVAINLRGCVMAVKHVLPVMRAQQSGVILTISSLAAYEIYPYVAYKATKAAMIAFTQQVAIQNAQYGIRANCILPGLMDTPMAVDTRARATGKPRAEVAAARDAKVPLRGKMGTAWDVANAALFLASTRPISSPAWRCRSTAARWSRSGEATSQRLPSADRPYVNGARATRIVQHVSEDASFPNAVAPRRARSLWRA